jgi:hypothetical protein
MIDINKNDIKTAFAFRHFFPFVYTIAKQNPLTRIVVFKKFAQTKKYKLAL